MSKNRQQNQQQNVNQNVRVVYKVVTAEQYNRIMKLEAAENSLRQTLQSVNGNSYNVDLNGATGGTWINVEPKVSRRARRQASRKIARRTAPVAKTPSLLDETRSARRWIITALLVVPVVLTFVYQIIV
jgi:hypothetical protein